MKIKTHRSASSAVPSKSMGNPTLSLSTLVACEMSILWFICIAATLGNYSNLKREFSPVTARRSEPPNSEKLKVRTDSLPSFACDNMDFLQIGTIGKSSMGDAYLYCPICRAQQPHRFGTTNDGRDTLECRECDGITHSQDSGSVDDDDA